MPTGPVLGSKTKPKPAQAPVPIGPPPIAPAKLPKIPLGKGAVSDEKPAVDRQEELAKKAIWAAAAVFGLLIIYMIAGRLVAVVTRWPATIMEPVAASHCRQFIDLAKTAYGENWRVRLDPRDTTCDQEVKSEWERQQLTRYEPPPTPLWGPAPTEQAAPARSESRVTPATRCLNVVSLAQTKYGAEWRSKLTGPDAVCAGGGEQTTGAPAEAGTATSAPGEPAKPAPIVAPPTPAPAAGEPDEAPQ
jgi:hypothetical protein